MQRFISESCALVSLDLTRVENIKSALPDRIIMAEKEVKRTPPGLGSRAAVSIIVVFGWLIYAIIHVVFIWEHFSTIQNIALIIISFLFGLAILGAIWASWGIKVGREYAESCKE